MLPDGKEADMIEAVAEGVIFNNLGHIMDTHINRMLVLRPRLTDAELDHFLLQVFTYLGEGYDFRFDFVLYAEEDPNATQHGARVMLGDAGAGRLQALMQQAAH